VCGRTAAESIGKVIVLYALGVVIFAVGLLLSIALHEIGHLVPAKRFGVKVTQYMVGFGPTLWSRNKGGTEYGLKVVPLGGYIRMIGMVPPQPEGGRSRWPRRLASAVEDFRSASRSDVVDESDEPRQFYRLSPGKKMIVMLGGPIMNLIIYLILTVLLFTVIGKATTDYTLKVGSVAQCVVAQNSADAASNACPADAPSAPAAAVLKPGDVLVDINGAKLTTWQQAVDVIQSSAGKTVNLTIDRAGTLQNVSLTPVENIKYASATSSKTIRAGYIGVGPVTRNYFAHESITQVPGEIGSQLHQAVSALASYPSKIHSLWQTVFEGKPRDINGAVGVVGLGEIGGQVASSKSVDVTAKIYSLLGLLASVNLLLFFFNLLPLLPLDGGHVAGALVEAAKRGRARLRDRRDVLVDASGVAIQRTRAPIYVDTAQMLPVMYAVASILIALTLLVVYADIVKPIHLN
jgi:membrane-associated protease RseP (regulator of RpoE activity)